MSNVNDSMPDVAIDEGEIEVEAVGPHEGPSLLKMVPKILKTRALLKEFDRKRSNHPNPENPQESF